MSLDPSQVRVWRRGWWRFDSGAWVAVESQRGTAQWASVSATGRPNSDLVNEALALSSGAPVAYLDTAGAVYLATNEWGRRCMRRLVGDAGPAALSSLPSPPLVVVLRPHPPGGEGLADSIRLVKEAIELGRNNPDLVTWVRRILHDAGLTGPRGAPEPDRIVDVIFAAQKDQVDFVKDPVNGELMARPEHLLCLDPNGPCSPAGDCDDQLIVIGSAVLSVGIPGRLVIREYAGKKIAHITFEYDSNPRLGGPWKCIDPSTDDGACSSMPFVKETIVDLVNANDTPFMGLGDPSAAAVLGQPPATTTPTASGGQLPADQAAGWIGQIQRAQTLVTGAATRLRANSAALTAVRADLGYPAADTSTSEAVSTSAPLATYMQTGAWTAEAQAAESKLLQTADFLASVLADGLSGARAMYFSNGDILFQQLPGDGFAIRMAPGPNGGLVPTYYDAQGNVSSTLGLAPIIIGLIIAATSLAVVYVVGKICDALATTHHDDALTKIATAQNDLVAAGKQTPEQAATMVKALNDLDKAAPAPPSAWQKFIDAFPIATVLGAGAAGLAVGFGVSRLLSSFSFALPRRSTASAPHGRPSANDLYAQLRRRAGDKRRAGFTKQAAIYSRMADRVGDELPLTRSTRHQAEELIAYGP